MKKKILIVGCQGHIGFSLTKYLTNKYNIIATFNKRISKTYFNLPRGKNIKFLKLNVFNKKKINKLFDENKIDTCIYCGVTHDSFAKNDPENTIVANSLGVIIFSLQKKKTSNLFI